MVLRAYCKQRSIQLCFERSYCILFGNIALVLTLPQKGFWYLLAVWRIIQKYKVHGTISPLAGTGRPFKLIAKTATPSVENRENFDTGTFQKSHICIITL